jgi:hypothetical protein
MVPKQEDFKLGLVLNRVNLNYSIMDNLFVGFHMFVFRLQIVGSKA